MQRRNFLVAIVGVFSAIAIVPMQSAYARCRLIGRRYRFAPCVVTRQQTVTISKLTTLIVELRNEVDAITTSAPNPTIEALYNAIGLPARNAIGRSVDPNDTVTVGGRSIQEVIVRDGNVSRVREQLFRVQNALDPNVRLAGN